MNNTENEIDLNKNGDIEDREFQIYEEKAWHRRNMAWLSLIAAIISGFCIMFLVPDDRLSKIDGLLELYWIGLLTITGTYVGVSTWTSKR